ncbi:FkbM family methyltransferase [Opitutus sp. ER46]|uniref:class I SAM-dependent methyltransferase n=1 Tax=Opitutus sp. ER46 TaxID=2161864 RepID=UPI000D31C0BB|nr:FkbM family methyltransferase [Opitutus sp. ER46]PTX98421.1 hypothetical protein DB354_03895 [Opitutus sp. ER46]
MSSPHSDRAQNEPLRVWRAQTLSGSLRADFLQDITRRFGITAMVDVGSDEGESAVSAATNVQAVDCVRSGPVAAATRVRCKQVRNITVHEGAAPELISQILPSATGRVLVSLNAYGRRDAEVVRRAGIPVISELQAIGRGGRKDVIILIGDIRLFENRALAVETPAHFCGFPSLNDVHRAVLAIDEAYQFLVLGDVAVAVPPACPCEATDVVQAITISRLFDGANLPIEELMSAEGVIGTARGEERAALLALPEAARSSEAFGLGLHYRLWQALVVMAGGQMSDASERFAELVQLGFPQWRGRWYGCVSLHLAGNNVLAIERLREFVAGVPDFLPAQTLLKTLAPNLPATAAPASQPSKDRPRLNPGEDACAALIRCGVHREGTPLRLHLGCGEKHFDGYVNVDYPPSEHTCQTVIGADVFADVTKLRLQPRSVDEIRLHHVFEHFKRSDALGMLIIWHEALKVGGRLHLETPDVLGCAQQLVSDAPFGIKQAVIRHCFGSQEAGWAIHYDGWSEEKYRHVLSRLGFSVETKTWRWARPPYLANVEAMAVKVTDMGRDELLAAADALLREYIVAEVPSELGMWDVWRRDLRKYLAQITTPAGAKDNVLPQRGMPMLRMAGEAALNCGFDNDNPQTNGEFRVVHSFIKAGDTVFDVGANIGDWSRAVLSAAPGVRVHAFEPTPSTFEILSTNLGGTDATLHRLAFAAMDEQRPLICFEDRSEFSGMNSFFRRADVEHRLGIHGTQTVVTARRLDCFMAEIGIAEVSFLKIDTEGGELEVLRGASEALGHERIKVLQFEYGGTYRDAGITLREVYQYLTGFGYRVFRICTDALIAVDAWDSSLENFRYSNYLALAPGIVEQSAIQSAERALASDRAHQ